jgi:transcriptional regulator with XRE-family HTH domain
MPPAVTAPQRPWDYEKLRAWREATGRTRQTVAEANGIAESWLAMLETGKTGTRSAGVDTLAKLAAYYGHTLPELLVMS